MKRDARAIWWFFAFGLALTASAAWADNDPAPGEDLGASRAPYGSVRGWALSGDVGYYTYGMDEVNNRFNQWGDNAIHGGLGYGVSAKLGLTDRFAAKLGIDYLFASRNATRTIGSVTYDTTVNLPATMVVIGGEYVLFPLPTVNLKLSAGYTLVNIYNGNQKSNGSSYQDLGNVTGTGSGFQVGLGAEVFLNRGFSLEGNLAYNYANIGNADFTAPLVDPGTTNFNASVDYSGLVAKLALNIYLFR
jgi:hypothetical protein